MGAHRLVLLISKVDLLKTLCITTLANVRSGHIPIGSVLRDGCLLVVEARAIRTERSSAGSSSQVAGLDTAARGA
jgi:hypothetical protein